MIPCETFVTKFLPVIRRILARELYFKYKIPQTEIAKRLGTTQAAISLYIKGNRGRENEIRIPEEEIKKFAEELYKNPNIDIKEYFCKICKRLRKINKFENGN